MSHNPKEIAERIINDGDTSSYFTDDIEPLARAYLELGKDYEKLYSDYTNLLNSGQAKEITKLEACVARLKEENDKYKNVLVKGAEWIEWKFGKPNRMDFERIFVREKKG